MIEPDSRHKELSVGQLSARSGVAVTALHFYETKGLIHSHRNAGNQRRYPRSELRRVSLIKVAQRLGIPLAEIGQALAEQTERLAQGYGGFLSASVQASDDGRRVLNYLQWQSREAGEAAFRRFENGEQDFWQLILAHQAKTVTFGSFQVRSSIARSHDNALHCDLPG